MPCPPFPSAYGNVMVVSSTTRPTALELYAGRWIYETDTGRTLLYDGTGWIVMDEPTQNYTPALVNIAIGTGGNAANNGRYRRSGGWVDVKFQVVLGTSGASVGASPTIGIPFASLDGYELSQIPMGLFDSSAAQFYPGSTVLATATTIGIYAFGAAATYTTYNGVTSTIPFTWAAGDFFEANFRYQMATRYL